MADPIVVSCPECKKQLKLRADLQGKKIRCKNCEAVFTVKTTAVKPASRSKPAPAPEPELPVPLKKEEEEGDNPYDLTFESSVPRCPFCIHEMEPGAIICLNCGYNTATRERVPTKAVYESTGLDYFIWWLPAIACILAILLMIGYCVFHHFALPDMAIDNWEQVYNDPNKGDGSRSRTARHDDTPGWALIFHPALEVWLVVISLVLSWKCGKFAYKRLVKEPHPPEIEKRT
jgi:DNA-directed RNA polymerase subunit M/transcription elongation factor TFIIS